MSISGVMVVVFVVVVLTWHPARATALDHDPDGGLASF